MRHVAASSSDNWQAMNVAQKAKYETDAKRLSVKNASSAQQQQSAQADAGELHCLNMAARSVWGLGDHEFPYKVARLQADIDRARANSRNAVADGSSEWHATAAEPVVESMLDPFPGDVESWPPLCSEKYGIGRCRNDFTQTELDAVDLYDAIISSIADSLDQGELERVPLLWLDAFSIDGRLVAQKLLLLIGNCGQPVFQVYAYCELLTEDGSLSSAEQLLGQAVDVKMKIVRDRRWRLPEVMTTSHLACNMATAVPLDAVWSWNWQSSRVAKESSMEDGVRFHVAEVKPLRPFELQVRQRFGDPAVTGALRTLRMPLHGLQGANKRRKGTRRAFAGFSRAKDVAREEEDDEEEDVPPADPDVHGVVPGLKHTTIVYNDAGTPLGSFTAMETGAGAKVICVCYGHGCRKVVDADEFDANMVKRWLRKACDMTGLEHFDAFDRMALEEPLEEPDPVLPPGPMLAADPPAARRVN